MSKYIKVLFILLVSFLLISCNDSNKPEPIIDPEFYDMIRVDSSNMPESVKVKDFRLDMLSINVYCNNKIVKTVTVTEDMLSEEDLNKLSTYGVHTLNITYEGIYTTFALTLLPNHPLVKITFIVDGEVYKEYETESTLAFTSVPEIPAKDGYIASWNVSSDAFDEVNEDMEVRAIYIKDQTDYLNSLFDSLYKEFNDTIISKDIVLVTNAFDATVTWESNNPDAISNEGKYNVQKVDTPVEFTVTITLDDFKIVNKINMIAKGYKDLSKGNIATGYVYRSYDLLTDEFFETMDIIYCAFVPVDVNGLLTGNDTSGHSIANEAKSWIEKMVKYVIPRAHDHGDYVIASLGGGGSVPCATFSEIAKSEEARKNLAETSVYLINTYGFDGVDIDWETPTASEKGNFTLLMKELHDAIKAVNDMYLVTVPITGGMWQPPRYDLANSHKYIDFINVMTYGMTSSGGQYQNALYKSTSNNDTVNKCGSTLTSCSIEESGPIFTNEGVDKKKLLFGLAFYGMKQEKSSGSWKSAGSILYPNIKSYINSGEYKYVYDKKAGVPYLISKDGLEFISYDDPTSIIEKCKFIKDNGYGGVTYWENGCDTTGDLVHAVNEGLKK